MIEDLWSKIGAGGAWSGVMHSALAMYAAMSYMPRAERYSWPEDRPTLERELIRTHSGNRVRVRRVGGKWLGWDAIASPANFTLGVDSDGMSIYGTRCRLSNHVS